MKSFCSSLQTRLFALAGCSFVFFSFLSAYFGEAGHFGYCLASAAVALVIVMTAPMYILS